MSENIVNEVQISDLANEVRVDSESTIVNIGDGETIVVKEEVVSVVSVGIQGPPGRIAIGGIAFQEEEFEYNEGNIFNLKYTPIEDSLSLYINGIKQRTSNYNVVERRIDINIPHMLYSDDIISVSYYYLT